MLQFYWLLQTCFKNIDIDKLLLQYNTENNTTKRKIIIQKIRVKWKYSILMNEMTYVDELFQQKKSGRVSITQEHAIWKVQLITRCRCYKYYIIIYIKGIIKKRFTFSIYLFEYKHLIFYQQTESVLFLMVNKEIVQL